MVKINHFVCLEEQAKTFLFQYPGLVYSGGLCCKKIEPEPGFLHLEVIDPFSGQDAPVSISLPYHYVRAIFHAKEAKRILGFCKIQKETETVKRRRNGSE